MFYILTWLICLKGLQAVTGKTVLISFIYFISELHNLQYVFSSFSILFTCLGNVAILYVVSSEKEKYPKRIVKLKIT